MAGDSFYPGAHWEILECTDDFIEEHFIEGFHRTTVTDGEISLHYRQNFSHNIERMIFTGKAELTKCWRDREIVKNIYRVVKFDKQPPTATEPNLSFFQKHKLVLES